jgi:hypothetical protein
MTAPRWKTWPRSSRTRDALRALQRPLPPPFASIGVSQHEIQYGKGGGGRTAGAGGGGGTGGGRGGAGTSGEEWSELGAPGPRVHMPLADDGRLDGLAARSVGVKRCAARRPVSARRHGGPARRHGRGGGAAGPFRSGLAARVHAFYGTPVFNITTKPGRHQQKKTHRATSRSLHVPCPFHG